MKGVARFLVSLGAVALACAAACSSSNNSHGNGSGGISGSGGSTNGTGGNLSNGSGGLGSGGSGNTGSGGSGTVACSRDLLVAATQNLAQALGAADATKLPLASNATYHENLETPSFTQGIWANPLKIAHQRDFIDVDMCQTYSEIVVTDDHAYVLGFRLTLSGGKVSDVTALVADDGDFHFDATAFLAATTAEDWSVVPEQNRPTRDQVTAAGDAYFNSFNDTSIQVPYGPNCTRLEGTADGPCSEGLPPPGRVMVTDRQVLVDLSLGTAVSIDRFRGLPDSHLFRMVSGEITSIHAVIICDPTCTPPATGGAGGGGMGGNAGSGGAGGMPSSGGVGAGGIGGGSAGAGGKGGAGNGGRGGMAGSGS